MNKETEQYFIHYNNVLSSIQKEMKDILDNTKCKRKTDDPSLGLYRQLCIVMHNDACDTLRKSYNGY